MGLFGRDDAKRVGFGRRPKPEERPRSEDRPRTDERRGGFDDAIDPKSRPSSGTGGGKDIDPGGPDARTQEVLDAIPDDAPDWVRKLAERAAPYAARAEERRSGRTRRAPGFVFVIMGLLALGFIGIGVWFLIDAVAFTDSARTATGEVIAVTPHRDDDGGTTYTPRFAYTDADGVRRTGETHISSSTYDYAPGERVAILYDPADPRDVRIDDWFSLWGFPMIFIAAGLFSETVLVLIFVFRARRRRA